MSDAASNFVGVAIWDSRTGIILRVCYTVKKDAPLQASGDYERWTVFDPRAMDVSDMTHHVDDVNLGTIKPLAPGIGSVDKYGIVANGSEAAVIDGIPTGSKAVIHSADEDIEVGVNDGVLEVSSLFEGQVTVDIIPPKGYKKERIHIYARKPE